jgi:hypothetical protein
MDEVLERLSQNSSPPLCQCYLINPIVILLSLRESESFSGDFMFLAPCHCSCSIGYTHVLFLSTCYWSSSFQSSELTYAESKPGFEGPICKAPQRVWIGPSGDVGRSVAESGPGAIITGLQLSEKLLRVTESNAERQFSQGNGVPGGNVRLHSATKSEELVTKSVSSGYMYPCCCKVHTRLTGRLCMAMGARYDYRPF